MKKIFALLLTLIMCVSASVTVFAANAAITATGDKAERNEIVYVTVALENCANANTLGISIEYDSSALKKLASRCQWMQTGDIQDFDATKDNGVWYVDEATNLNGNICKLAFQVKADAPIGKTNVKCAVTVKNDATVVGVYEATAVIEVTCEHEGEAPTKVDDTKHGYTCVHCDTLVTEAHTWDTGVVTKPATATVSGEKTYTCSVCNGTKVEPIPATGSGDEPGGNTPGDDTGNQGGNTGNQGGNTGNQGGNTGNQGGNTGNQSGNTGNQGGNTGNQGGNTGNQGGNTGNQGGNTGNQGDNTGNQGDNTGNQDSTETPGVDSTENPGVTEDPGTTEDSQKPDDDTQSTEPGGTGTPSGDKEDDGNVVTVVIVILVIAAIAGGLFVYLKKNNKI